MKKNSDDHSLILQIESLEQRYMLAGDVTAAVSGGSLEIEGDDQDNVIAVTQFNGDYAVIGIDTNIEDDDFSTSIFGIDIDVKLLSGVSKNVEANLKGGDDVFLMNGSLDGIDFIELLGSDFSVGPAEVGRDLKIFTGGGRDAVAVLNTEVGRDLQINTGFGFEDVVVVGGAGAITGLLEFTSEYFDDIFAGADSLLGELGFWVDTNFDFDGDDIDLNEIGEIVGTIFGEVTTGRDLRIFGGSSHDEIFVGGVDIGRDSVIETALGDDDVYFGVGSIVDIFGDFDFANTEGFDGGPYYFDLGEIGISGESYVGRNAIFSTSMGEDFAMVGGGTEYQFYLPDFDLPELEEGFSWHLATVAMDGGLFVGRELRIDTGSHDDHVRIASNPIGDNVFDLLGDDRPTSNYDVTVGRDLKVITNSEDDIVEIGELDNKFDGPQVESIPEGGHQGPPADQGLLYVARNAVIDTGTGKDELFMGQDRFDHRELSARGDDNGDNGEFLIEIGRDLDIRTGTHDDYVEIADSPSIWGGGRGLPFFDVGTLFVGRDMDVDVDGGNDILLMAANDNFEPAAEADFGSTDIYVGDDLNIETGNQDDEVVINNTQVNDDTKIETSFGRDHLEIRDSYLGSKVDIGTGAERDTVEIQYTEINDDLRIRTDSGDDNVYVDDVYIGGRADIATSRGNDWVEMRYSTVNERTRIDTREGEDRVEIYQLFGEELEVKTGDDDDHVCAFDSSFDDGAEFDLGRGEDGISTNISGADIENEEGPADC